MPLVRVSRQIHVRQKNPKLLKTPIVNILLIFLTKLGGHLTPPRLVRLCMSIDIIIKPWFSHFADDRRIIVSDNSKRKFTNEDFTHE